jgi:hypothetical protein
MLELAPWFQCLVYMVIEFRPMFKGTMHVANVDQVEGLDREYPI